MANYKEKALYHLKRKTFANFWRLEEENNLVFMYETKLDKFFKCFESWKEAYRFLYFFTRSTKRDWIDGRKRLGNRVWDTDLEPEEQDCVDYMLEFFNYEQDSFELEELREILAENTDNENTVSACEILINVLIKHDKKTIEVE